MPGPVHSLLQVQTPRYSCSHLASARLSAPFFDLIFFIGYLAHDVTVIIMCFPLALGLAYLTIFGLHYSGLLKMVPDDGTAEKTDTRESKNPIAESDDIR